MHSHSPVVMLVAPPAAAGADVVGPLADAGFVTRRYGGPSPPPAPAAFVVLADALDEPLAFLRRLRGLEPSAPILWLVDKGSAALAPTALDAGADACLLRPANGPLLVAQLRALLRARTVAATADELRELTGRLQRLYDQSEQDAGLAGRLADLGPKAVPDSAGWRFGAVGGGLDTVARGDERAVILVEAAGLGAVGGALVASAVGRALARGIGTADPAAALTAVSRALRALGLPESAVVSATVAAFDSAAGRVRAASAGFPAPVLVRSDAPAEVWVGSGLFLAAADTVYAEMVADLAPGEKLILLGRGAADRRPDVREIADAHRRLAARPLADALATGLGADADPALVVAERADT